MTGGSASARQDAAVSASVTSKTGCTANTRPDAFLRTLALVSATLVLWLATRPYFGVIQDARFYMVEALRDLDPARFAGDLYFQFGSQGNFSLFHKLYLPFLPHFGVAATGLGFTIAGQLLWLTALFFLVRSLVGERYRWLSIAAVIAMPSMYAPFFGYGEHFATPRLFAEALTMLALALLRLRPLWTFVLLGLAATLHPLMALPGLVAAFAYFAFGRPVLWIAVPVGAVFAMALGWAGMQPFANLYRTLDPDWFAIVKAYSFQCLVTSWSHSDQFRILGTLIWTGFALLIEGVCDRRLLAAVLLAGIGGLACALLGSDLAHNVLITGLQPWRSMWLLQLVSRIYTPVIFGVLAARSAVIAERKVNPFAVAVLLTLSLILVSDISRLAQIPNAAEFNHVSLVLVAGALAVMFVQLVLVDQRYRLAAWLTLCLSIVLVFASLSMWDNRTAWTRFVESPAPPPQDLAILLPRNASIYWEDSVEMPWLRLKRSSYYSCNQGTGAVFHRETAMTYKDRTASFWPLRTADFTQATICASFDKTPKPERTHDGLQKLCRREKGLDYLVLLAPLQGVQAKIWKSPVRFQDFRSVAGVFSAHVADRFYIYSCADVR